MSTTRPFRARLWRWLVAGCLAAAVPLALAQNATTPQDSQSQTDSQSSIAAAARDAKAQKNAHSKKVFTDDDVEATAGPLPRLKMEGAENADEVVAAIASYKATHTPEQTEQAVRIWYDRYDEMLAAAIQGNQNISAIRQANLSNGEELCQQSQEYEQCQKRRVAEYRGQRSDQAEMAKNAQLEVRIQHVFGKIRGGLMQHGLHYDWFKVRTTNNIDTF